MIILLTVSGLLLCMQSYAGNSIGYKSGELKTHNTSLKNSSLPQHSEQYNKSHFNIPKVNDHRAHVLSLFLLQDFSLREFGGYKEVTLSNAYHFIPFGRLMIFPNHYFW